VSELEYITSPGERVRAIVIEHGVLERTDVGWELNDLGLPAGDVTAADALPWSNVRFGAAAPAQALNSIEIAFVIALRAEAREGVSCSRSS
jgi:hypothetical protein